MVCSARFYICPTGRAVPAALAPLASLLRAQCMMVYTARVVTIGCTLFFHEALWETMSALNREYKNSLNIWTQLQNDDYLVDYIMIGE